MVYLVDDEPGMRKALRRLLSLEGFEVRDFASADEFIASCHLGGTACLVLDVSMPGMNGMDLQKQLVRAGAAIPIIFLTANGDIPMSVQAIKAGAVDFLTKPVNDTELIAAVRTALNLATIRNAEKSALDVLARRHASLTPREREVMVHVVAGHPNKRIAADLGTGEQNIKIHRGRVMEKMGVDSLADLVRAAERLGL